LSKMIKQKAGTRICRARSWNKIVRLVPKSESWSRVLSKKLQ